MQKIAVEEWKNSKTFNENIYRKAIGTSAKNGKWFKTIGIGEELGKIIIRYLQQISNKSLFTTIENLKQWIYG